ncbi:hypothetical protein KC865_05070 [Candidatus Kaiserbacteria bacterium]|nr:hypothetical protein [Candidatus Kaiserbacteria bacterium]USN92209.1 MAG: hypothetical protein H6782_00035 [Candidatus Nomurabacteria bacterium]
MIKNNQGFIALSSVLILSAIFLSITIGITSNSITVSGTGIAFKDRDEARYTIHACLEHARMELQRTLGYRGDEVLQVGDNQCEILVVEGIGNTDRIIKVHSRVGEQEYFISENIDQISPKFIISSSERVTQF